MTNQEALTELRASIEGCGFQCHIETYRSAIGALEKQVPSKPKRIGYRKSDNGRFITTHTECPSCDYGVIERYKYCPDCGQALDWEDSNNENT